LKVKVGHANVTSRILPVRIHDLDAEDVQLFEKETGAFLRPIDFIFKSTGVNRPLVPQDERAENQNHTVYRDQANKVAMAIKEIIGALKTSRQAKAEVPSETTHAASEKNKKSQRKFLVPALLAAVFLLLAYAGFTLFKEIWEWVGNSSESEIDRSIAVLPFANMSADKEQEYFSDGLSEELLNLLAKTQNLKVISRTSAFSFKGKNEDIRTIGQKLGVAYLLEGSVRKSADKVRITAQLIKASDGSHVWSETFDKDLNDIFKIQDEIANAVVSALKVKLLGTNQIAARQSNPDVYNLILQSRFYQKFGTRDGFAKAIDYAQQAVALDSTDARALSELARCYQEESNSSDDPEVAKAYIMKADVTARKAIQLDPYLSDAYGIYARVLSISWQFKESEQNFQRALELDPANVMAANQMAILQQNMGNFAQSEQLLERVISIDPIRANAYANLGWLYLIIERYDESDRYLLKAIELGARPTHYLWYAVLNLMSDNKVKALEAVNKVDDPFWQENVRLLWLWKYGDKAEYRKRLKVFETEYETVGAYQVAEIYAWEGDVDKTFHWLDLAYKYRDPGLAEIKMSVPLKNAQNDPRYRAMLEKLKLPI
jgi:TolB-like protein/Flp pilus assembly protein TadD